MNHTFEFYLNSNHKSFTVVQFFHTEKKAPKRTIIGKVVANNIPKKFVQRYVDKLLSLGYDREIGSNNELIILTSPESQS